MIRHWFAARRSLILTVTSGSVIAALIAVIAVVSGGYSARKVDLQDAAVWVSNAAEGAIGRANTEVLELNSVMSDLGGTVSILQSGTTVLVVDRTSSTLEVVDSATSTVIDDVPLPPDAPEVFLTGETVVILSGGTGEVWFVPLASLSDFDAEAQPTLSLGAGLVSSIDDAGSLFSYSPSTQQVYRMTPAASDEVQSTDDLVLPADAIPTITSVDDRWAVLDSSTGQLYLSDREVTLAMPGNAAASVELQVASADGTRVILADSGGAVAVELDSGDQSVLVDGQAGTPAPPVVVAGCILAGWSAGTAWRECSGDDATDASAEAPDADGVDSAGLMTLQSMPASATPVFQVNGTRALLNDTRDGGAWLVQGAGELINNWADLIPPDDSAEPEVVDDDSLTQVDEQQQPPVATDDEFGVRPGRTSTLPVLLNDYDANGDVVVVSEFEALDESVGFVDAINNNQLLQVTMADTSRGTASFQYTITDGRGGSATATVTLTVRAASENSPPEQVRSTSLVAPAGGRATTEVLGDWVDPDGDAFYLASATTAAPDSVTFKPSGTLIFSDEAPSSGAASVLLAVSDGTAVGNGSVDVRIEQPGAVPLVAEAFIVRATAGTAVTVTPLAHVHGGSAEARLVSVPAKPDVTILPAYEAGTFQFSSTSVGTHYLEYVVTDGDLSATGVVRVDVSAPVVSSRPVTVPKTVFVQSLQSEQVDVAGTDIDPGGAVLVVTGLSNLPPASGVSAEIIEQRYVRVRLDTPLAGAVTFNYSISNGLASAEGTITVIEIAAPPSLQPPIARDDSITVRAGATTDIAVLDNDEHPDGAALTLLPALAEGLPEDSGLLFASGTVLRYLAPATPGNFVAVYEIAGPDGQRARAQVDISVREADTNTNAAPVPAPLTARVLAGGTVTIPVPLTGIDPDGDTVQLLGQETSPERGSVIAVGADSITYRAGDYSTGTDSFDYAVVDALGARATGTVRVGISARLDGARNPVATLDEVATRPGTTVSVRVLANDSDPDGTTLSVASAVPNDSATTARVDGDIVVITPGETAGVYGVVYTIENELGGTSSNFIRVTVSPDAPLSYPIVTDAVLTLSDIVDRDEVTVDVLAGVFFADGDPSSLTLSVYPGYDGSARVTTARTIRVSVTRSSQIIPFAVTHPEDASIVSFGFIRVPGLDDALPQLNANAPRLTVVSEQALTIQLDDYVLAAEGRSVQLTDTSSVRATHNNGASLVVDRDTLVFTSADQFFGEASISFEVTDGESATDPAGRTATLVLAITVLPRENQPAVFAGAVLQLEPAESKKIDLTRLTTYPYPNDIGELQYTLLSVPENMRATLTGQSLTIAPGVAAGTGSMGTLLVGVRDALTEGKAGRIEVEIVPSTRPLARPATDIAPVRRGQNTVVDVLGNDNATNPFPGTPLRVIAIRGADNATLPAGVRVTPSVDNATLTVSVAATAAPTDTTLQYQVMDATGDPTRAVWGTVRISVQDRPDAVSDVSVTAFADRRLTVTWTGGQFNNSPITGYRVALQDAVSGATVGGADCTGSRCTVTTPGNGPDSSVIISVVARNAIGASDPAVTSAATWSDVVPGAPTGVRATPLDHGLRISWAKPESSGGSAITSYVLTVAGAGTQEYSVPERDAVGTVYTRDITNAGLGNGTPVAFSVSARNSASTTLATWNSAAGSGIPAGAPVFTAPPVASAEIDDPDTIVLNWGSLVTANGRPVSDYYAAVFTGEAPQCSVRGDLPGSVSVPQLSDTFRSLGTGTSTSFGDLSANTTYKFAVYAFNGMGCTTSPVVELTPRQRPGSVESISVSEPLSSGSSTWDIRLDDFVITRGSTDASSLIYRLGGGTVEGGESGPITPGGFFVSSNGSHYGQDLTVQVKACANYPEYSVPVCSADWSAPLPLGVPVNNTTLGSLSATVNEPEIDPGLPATGSYSWASSPRGRYDSVSYSCGGAPVPIVDGAGGQCTVVADNNGTFPGLTITITVGGAEYTRAYGWNDYTTRRTP
ncbi:hypothetical protein B0I08_102295 [Glaciihabitans tibetensis]|uniref:Fibronectin type-III domain-containing protein n=1 Tax=Glaciihabitans tibetensis TaxID=1266600 RepID=A0A2T0VHC4_9MICO|nr:Ig-like domain-containing protein [Glaciihabitans tibetensis]PRY69618.1 hypothetical protein B0I08_102295 [Glaciihabitans tibetensis]